MQHCMGKHSSIREHHVGRIPPSVSSVWQAHYHHEALHGKHQALGENGAHASSPVQPQSGKVAPQQGCSQGFQRALKTESWRGAGVMVARCFLIATDILPSTASNSASLSGFSGRDSAGSREMSKSRGGSWWVTSPEHAHTLPPWQLSEPSGETLGVT